MTSPAPHESLIRAAAKLHLAPLGFRQKGRSRVWLRDHGWWLSIVEFQPSSWSKGSYLNVACMWLWCPHGHLAFHVCERLGRYAEFVDHASFQPAADGLARLAAEGSLKNEPRFSNIQAVYAYLDALTVGSQSHWDHYNAMMAALACGKVDSSVKHWQSLRTLGADYEWCEALQSRAMHVMEVARTNKRAAVEEQVNLARERLTLPPATGFSWAADEV